jgi:hypothetical protein
MCHLREFFIVHHMREKEEKCAEVVTIPRIQSQQLVLDLSGQGQSYQQLVKKAELTPGLPDGLFSNKKSQFG